MPDATKRCPYCAEVILVAAIRCKHCSMMLDGSVPVGTPPPPGATPYPAGTTTAPGAAAAWWQVAGPLKPGTEVREYCIERMLGEGGMGEVYLAEQTTTGRQVAMKVVAPELMRDEGVRRRFMEEARVMAALDHPSIVSLYTFFEEGGRFFLVMKYVAGESLDDRINRAGPMSVDEAVRVSTAVLAALDYAHNRPQPVVHRDIKPANIQLGKDGSAVVMDFGIAKAIGREKLTRTAGIVGTYEYMSPEQIMGGEVGQGTDIYCFGITLYKMLTGVVPFPQKTDTGIDCMDGHRHQPILPLAEFRDGLPDWLQGLMEKALAKDPAARFPSASAMSVALEQASSTPRAPLAPPPTAKPVVEPPLEPPPPARPAPPPTPAPLLVEEDQSPTGLSVLQKVLIAAGLACVILVVVFAAATLGDKRDGSKEGEDKYGEKVLKATAQKVPDAPDKVVVEAVRAVKDGDLVLLYAMLPESYRRDIQNLYDKIPAKVDGTMYARVWPLLDKVLVATKKHRHKLAEGAPIPIDQIIGPVEEFLALSKECKLNDYEAMKALNVAAFLADHGKKLSDYGWKTAGIFKKGEVEMARSMMDGIKAEAKDVNDDAATVVVTAGEKTEEMAFVKVEGKWIPKGLADDWKEAIAKANKGLDEFLAGLEMNKEQINAFLTSADDALTKFDESGNLGDLGPLMGAMQAF